MLTKEKNHCPCCGTDFIFREHYQDHQAARPSENQPKDAPLPRRHIADATYEVLFVAQYERSDDPKHMYACLNCRLYGQFEGESLPTECHHCKSMQILSAEEYFEMLRAQGRTEI